MLNFQPSFSGNHVPRRIASRAPADMDAIVERSIIRPVSHANALDRQPAASSSGGVASASSSAEHAADWSVDLPPTNGRTPFSEQRTLKHQTPPDLVCSFNIRTWKNNPLVQLANLSLTDNEPTGLLDDDKDKTLMPSVNQRASAAANSNASADVRSAERSPFVGTPDGSSDGSEHEFSVSDNTRSTLSSKLHTTPGEHLNNGYSFGLPPTPRVPMGACFRFDVVTDPAFYRSPFFQLDLPRLPVASSLQHAMGGADDQRSTRAIRCRGGHLCDQFESIARIEHVASASAQMYVDVLCGRRADGRSRCVGLAPIQKVVLPL